MVSSNSFQDQISLILGDVVERPPQRTSYALNLDLASDRKGNLLWDVLGGRLHNKRVARICALPVLRHGDGICARLDSGP